jgi:hypothetical protein
MDVPAEIWNTQKEKFDTASSRAGQLALTCIFANLQPLDNDTSINQYIARLKDVTDQLARTEQEILD